MLAVAAVVSLGAGIAAGLIPALQLTRRGEWGRLQRAGRTFADPTSRLRSYLVSGQIAVAVILLSGGALLFGSFIQMRDVHPGFDPEGLVVLGVDVKGATGWDIRAPWVSWDALADELRAVPGVEAVAIASNVPLQRSKWAPKLLLPGDTP